MIEKLKWIGWILSSVLLVMILLQHSCSSQKQHSELLVHDTIVVHGDSQLYLVQDTVLKPYNVYYPGTVSKVDTSAVINDYFASRIYRDTIKARDVTAVIEDSISDNKIAGHKVLIENSRDLHLTTLLTKPVIKIFIGGFAGYSQRNLQPAIGISLALLTKKDALIQYHYDMISGMHSLGFGWKLHFGKSK